MTQSEKPEARTWPNASPGTSTLYGDGPCSSCATKANLVWFTESVFWNAIVRTDLSEWGGNEPILCIECFVRRAERMGFRPTGWRLLPEWPWKREDEGIP